jgi:MFS family permease
MISQNGKKWGVLMMFMMAHAINDGFGWIIPPLLPAIREHFQLSYGEMGAFYTSFRFFGNIAQAPAAYLVHFVPISTILVSGLLWLSIGMFVSSLSSTYRLMVVFSAVGGIGAATYHPLAVAILSRVFGRDSLGRAVALHLSASTMGQVIAPLLVGLLLIHYEWRLPVQIWSGLGILVGVTLFLFLRSQEDGFQLKNKTLGFPFFSRPLGIYILAESLWGIAQMAMMTFLPLFLVDYRGFSHGKAAAVFGIMALSGTFFRPFLGALMDWMGRRKPVIIGGAVIAGLSILGIAKAETEWLIYLFVILLGTFGSGHAGLADTFMIEMIPSHRREETLGFVYTMRMGIASLSPFMVGLVSERIGLIHGFTILALISGLSVILFSLAEEKPVDS